jgi:two-component system, LytTR family, sensor kinase
MMNTIGQRTSRRLLGMAGAGGLRPLTQFVLTGRSGRSIVPEGMPQKHTASARLIIGVATLLGAFSTLQAYQAVRLFLEKPQSITTLALLNFSFWYGWAALTPVVLSIARRFPLERDTWKRSAPVHMLAVPILILLHVALVECVYVTVPGTGYLGKLTWWERVQRNYFWNFDWEMMTYAAIIAFSHAASYFRQAQDRALRAAHLEARLAEAQLQALQRQLHPHFLFNTLNGISALMHRDVQAADRMLVRLSDLLRMALDRRSAQEVPLSDDLEFLAKYLEIEQARFGERLSVRYDFDPDTLDALVPNLLLQPLVENSVRHAIAALSQGGVIEVTSRRVGDTLELRVRDNGPGLSKERTPSPSGGLGLTNTRSRLEHLYGSAQHLQFSDTPGGGLTVTVVLPFRRDAVSRDSLTDDVVEPQRMAVALTRSAHSR